MRTSICSNGYSVGRARSERGLADIDWGRLLPVAWRGQVIAPFQFDVFRDYEIAAERTLGRDADELPCYHACRYVLHELRSDDDEDFYLQAIHAEALTAWRLRDGRWLTYRVVGSDGDAARGFFSFSEDAPLRTTTGPLIAPSSSGC